MLPLQLIVSANSGGCRRGLLLQSRLRRLSRRHAGVPDELELERVVGPGVEEHRAHQHHQDPREDDSVVASAGPSVVGGEYDCHWLYYVLDFSSEYYIPLMISLGLVGNMLSGFVFLSSQLRVRSSSYYLAALALADFGFLFSLLLVWLNNSLGWKVFNKPGWCEGVVYTSSVCSSLSVWLIVGFTVERFIAIQYPLHRPRVCTISRAKCIIMALSLLALASHSYCFVTAGLVPIHPVNGNGEESEMICDMKTEYLETMRIVNLIDSVASLIGPLVLIVIMNTCIWRNLLRFGRLFEQHSEIATVTAVVPSGSTRAAGGQQQQQNQQKVPIRTSSTSSSNGIAMGTVVQPAQSSNHRSSFQFSSSQSNSHRIMRSQNSQAQQTTTLGSSRNVYQISEGGPRCIHVGSSSRNLMSTRNQQNITKMLLLISTVFITLNLPSYVIRICVFFFTLARKNTPALLWCAQQFFMLLYYTNFSINFLLYAMCGVTFRRCLRQLLCNGFERLKKYYCFSQ